MLNLHGLFVLLLIAGVALILVSLFGLATLLVPGIACAVIGLILLVVFSGPNHSYRW